jgi:hypothetical protein
MKGLNKKGHSIPEQLGGFHAKEAVISRQNYLIRGALQTNGAEINSKRRKIYQNKDDRLVYITYPVLLLHAYTGQ